MSILETAIPQIVAEEVARVLAPYAAGLRRFRRLVEASEAAESESVAPVAQDRPAPEDHAPANPCAIGDTYEFNQGRGTFRGTVIGFDAPTGQVLLKRLPDGLSVARSPDKLVWVTGTRPAATAPAKKAAKRAPKARKSTPPEAAKAAKKAQAPRAKRVTKAPAETEAAAPAPANTKKQKQPTKSRPAKKAEKAATPTPRRTKKAPVEQEVPAEASAPVDAEPAVEVEPVSVSEGQLVLFAHGQNAGRGKVVAIDHEKGRVRIQMADGSHITRPASQLQLTEA